MTKKTSRMSQTPYKLSIEAFLPKTAIEDENIEVTYRFTNIGQNVFPGGIVDIVVSWPSIGPTYEVGHRIEINKTLKPEECFETKFREKPATVGMTTFSKPPGTFEANDGKPIELYLPDRRKVTTGMVFGGVRVKSKEEVIEARNMKIAAISLVILIIFQIIDWIIRYLGNI